MVERPYAGKHRPVKTTEDFWCPFCPANRRRLYICDMHHWGSAPYFENRIPKVQPRPPTAVKKAA